MRLRARITYKVLALLVTCGILLIICLSYFAENDEKHSEFITRLPLQQEDARPSMTPLMSPLMFESHGDTNESILLNLTNFHYTLSNDLCRQYNKDMLAILIVTSYAGHDEVRAAHRQAITQSKLAEMGFQRIFLIAEIPSTERFITQKQLVSEQQRFGDLLQGNFQEAYRNLSYKHIMGLRWASDKCARAKFIVKLDDDIVYDAFQLRRYLELLEVEKPQLASSDGLLAGYILDAKAPIRNVANKWFVSLQEFAADTYPPYLSGWLYITNPPTARRLALHSGPSFFWIDDTWVTGVLREQLGIPLQRLNAWYSANAQFLDCCVRDLKQHALECEYFVGPNGGDTNLLVEFIHNVEKCYFDECTKRSVEKSLKQTCVASVKHLMPSHGDAMIEPLKLR